MGTETDGQNAPIERSGHRPAAPLRPRPIIAAAFLALVGAFLLVGGSQLVALGGSAYYPLAGLAMLACTVLLWRRQRAGFVLYGLFLAATGAWALWEVGTDFWGLFARLAAPCVVGLGLALGALGRRFGNLRVGAAVLCAGTLAFLLLLVLCPAEGPRPAALASVQPVGATEWVTYAGDLGATRHSGLVQITPANVASLAPLWTYRTGDLPRAADSATVWTQEVTPLKAGNRLFVCTAHSQIHAIDAETGVRLWKYDPGARLDWSPLRACRGVGYFKDEAAAPTAACAERVIAPTVDGRLVAVDAASGKPCQDFGQGGFVDQKAGLGQVTPGYYFTTSAPLVVGEHVIVGAQILDGATVGEPSGVIRAFNARTGAVEWAWDLGAADDRKGTDYTRGTPNAWAPLTADPQLGLVFVPLGNATPDFFGAHRSPAMERFGSALVALDFATGKLRWSFQTTHHDLWDQDIPGQPTLFELDTPGGRVPALVQPTKRGELFVLDRRTGKPLLPVEERPAPQGAAAGDFAAPTQPYSAGLPSLLLPRRFTEASAWGMTPLDQMVCRIAFRKLRYDGPLTPPSVQGTISYPGSAGIVGWGGVSIDQARQLLVVNSVHTPFVTRLFPRAQADALGLSIAPNTGNGGTRGSSEAMQSGAKAGLPQIGTPYAAQALPFLSPLGVPCMAPPWGRITAIDLRSRGIAWQRPFGTARDTGPFGWRVGLPLPLGVPSSGGPVTTSSGLTFIAASQDRFLRAIETATGRELWRARLPAGGQATPMTFASAVSGRQIVVVSAGGHGGLNTQPGDYILAYALKR